jgi:hypothetical protein
MDDGAKVRGPEDHSKTAVLRTAFQYKSIRNRSSMQETIYVHRYNYQRDIFGNYKTYTTRHHGVLVT